MDESGSIWCEICFVEYNASDQEARVIPSCGHSLCKNCVLNLLKTSKLACPFDRKAFNGQGININSFPINYTIQQFLERESKYEICTEHNFKKKLICPQDQVMVCEECVFDGNHLGHKIWQPRKIKAMATEKHEKFQSCRTKLNEWGNKFLNFFNEENFIVDTVKQNFIKLHLKLEEKQKEILAKVKNYFETEKKEFESFIGNKSSLMNDLEEAITNLNQVMTGENLLKFFKDHLQSVPALNDLHFQTQLEEQSLSMKEMKDYIEKLGSSFMGVINSMTFSVPSVFSKNSQENKQKIILPNDGPESQNPLTNKEKSKKNQLEDSSVNSEIALKTNESPKVSKDKG